MNPSTSRRDFLKTAGATTLLASAKLRSVSAETAKAPTINPTPKADTLILLWMAGGMAHTEMFDPKRHTPYRAGMRTSELVSTFPALDTVVPGIKFSAGLEKIGSVMDRGAVIEGICWYPITAYPGWDNSRHAEAGLLSTVISDGSRHVDERLFEELQAQRAQFACPPYVRQAMAGGGRY